MAYLDNTIEDMRDTGPPIIAGLAGGTGAPVLVHVLDHGWGGRVNKIKRDQEGRM